MFIRKKKRKQQLPSQQRQQRRTERQAPRGLPERSPSCPGSSDRSRHGYRVQWNHTFFLFFGCRTKKWVVELPSPKLAISLTISIYLYVLIIPTAHPRISYENMGEIVC